MNAAKVTRSFAFAAAGLRLAWRDQPNFRVEVGLAVGALVLCWWTGADVVPVLAMTGLVLALELVNSAVEGLVDLVHPERHALAAAVKDLAAAAVLVAAAAALLVGLVVIGPPLVATLTAVMGGG